MVVLFVNETFDSLLHKVFQRNTPRNQTRQITKTTLAESVEHLRVFVRVSHAVYETMSMAKTHLDSMGSSIRTGKNRLLEQQCGHIDHRLLRPHRQVHNRSPRSNGMCSSIHCRLGAATVEDDIRAVPIRRLKSAGNDIDSRRRNVEDH